MPHSSCDPCCDPTGNSRGVDQYRSSAIQVLCAILTAIQAGGTTALIETTPVEGANIPFGSVPAAYGTLISPGGAGRFLEVRNQTNQQIVISLDGATDFTWIEAGGVRVYDFASNGLMFSSDIEFKYDTVAPTTGQVLAAILR